ncbi:MAG: helix-turn-helix domain-containing protein [Propionibacteriaceae bacterium]|jgi:predicted dehydrogenase/AraC-like DNA-binding protein|nr:helix-turn-helix domain-containing protein [Propionibacteriaceae bacterium]
MDAEGRPLTVAVLGAGARGAGFGGVLAQWPERARVVAVAEPRREVRQRFAQVHHLAKDQVFADWRDLLDRPRLADMAIVALPDRQHADAAIGLSNRGYHLLVESPMATDWPGCLAVADTIRRNGTVLSVGHVLRYAPYERTIKRLVDQGAIGDIVAIDHIAPIGFQHFAHSFVRGNWAQEGQSSFILLGFAGHDIDWLLDLVGVPAKRVSSHGSLTYFRPESAPPQAADRCVTCPIERACPYSAPRVYRRGQPLPEAGIGSALADIVTGGDPSPAALDRALATGPYGRCVYRCDNDAPDHQAVSIEFANGVTAALTVTAFTPMSNRRTIIFGTLGQLTGDSDTIEVFDFRSGRTTVIDVMRGRTRAMFTRGTVEYRLLDAFVNALRDGRRELIVSDLDSTLRGQWLVFAADESRRQGRAIDLDGYPLDAEQRLIDHIRTGDRSGADQLIGQLLGALYLNSAGDFQAVLDGAADLVTLFTRAAVEGGADATVVFGEKAALTRKLAGFTTVDEVSTFLVDAFNRFVGYIFDFSHADHANALRRAVAYIQDHYAERIRLADVAQAAFLSPAYLSQVFKAKMGQTFTDYLADVRIDHGKELLAKTATPISEIATRVGFTDQSHFTKVFTRLTGTSPARFRRSGA